MIALLFLLFVFLHGLVLSQFLGKINKTITFAAGWILGSVICISFVYWTACIFKSLDISLLLFFFFSIQLVLIFKKQYISLLQLLRGIKKINAGVCIALFLFSYYLFGKTFGYDASHGNFLIASNVYLDFGAHIPFIRSFSMGANFPGEIPFFQNTGLLYYFLFDFYTAIIEHLGIRIDIAYNIISSVSFTFLLLLLYQVAYTIFKRRKVAILSVVFFLFPGNLSFITFFQKYGLNIPAWWHTNSYLESISLFFARGIPIEIFWNLNTYMNQRHFVFAIGFFLLTFYLLLTRKEKNHPQSMFFSIIIGIAYGLLVMWHAMVFISLGIVFISMLAYKNIRKELLVALIIAGCIALPQIILIASHSANGITFQPGFLLDHMLSVKNIFLFWFVNLGAGLITIPIGFYLSGKQQKIIFLCILPLFIIPNILHISSRFPFDDHKFFNLWIIFANMFSAYFIVKFLGKNVVTKIIAITCILFLTLSGIISIMVIKNDIFTEIPDISKNNFLQAVETKVPNNEITLTNGEIYDPATLTGKKTFVGRTQYIYVYGGDPNFRLNEQRKILQPVSQEDMIQTVQKNHIQYLILYKDTFAKNAKSFNRNFYDKTFIKLYEDADGIIYKI